MDKISEINWMLLAPELIIVAAAALLSIIDLLLDRKISRRYIGIFSLLAVVCAGIYVVRQFHVSEQLLQETYILEPFSAMIKLLILSGVACVILLSLAGKRQTLQSCEGEYYYLLLTATLGGLVMVSSFDLITLFVGLELLSISSYILVGIRKKNAGSAEAAWKYVVLGSVSSAFILYGMSFLYGLTGSTNLNEIKLQIVSVVQNGYGLYIYLALFLMILGFGFKIASAPFHTWAPDVYQGAYTPVTSFLAVVSKIAAFGLVLRIFYAYLPLIYFGEWQAMIQPLLLILAALSMIVGNTVALMQTNAKRVLAYSGIAQMGYLLIPLAMLDHPGNVLVLPSTFYYLIAYLLMTIGTFAILFLVTEDADNEEISAFAGLYQRSPLLAFLLSIFLISLAGFPITAGFLGKFYILLNTLHSSTQFIWVAIVMISTTIISYFYYFRFIRQMYFRAPASSQPLRTPWSVRFILLIGIVGTVGLAIMPNWVIEFLSSVNWFGEFVH